MDGDLGKVCAEDVPAAGDALEKKNCNVCGKGDSKHCSGCRKVFYCGKEHQTLDWKNHKKFCKNFQAANKFSDDEKVAGVIMYCKGDQQGDFFAQEMVPTTDQIFTVGEKCPVPHRVGIPLLIRRIPTKRLKSSYKSDDGELDNQPSTFLMAECNDGLAKAAWQNNVGNTLFVRADKKPLTEIQLEVIWMFMDRLMDAFGDGPQCAHREMNKQGFDRFWDLYTKTEIMNMQQGLRIGENIQLWESAVNPTMV